VLWKPITRAFVWLAFQNDRLERRNMAMTSVLGPTHGATDRRKLIAVLHADVVGYSRLIGLDDVGTLGRLGRLRRTIIDPTIDEHGGRIVNTAGDSLLIVFDSVDGAVRCAMKMQQHVATHDGDPPDRTIRFRVGINVGDVIPDGLDVHGDVVNVAARLQAECPPGSICVSRAVRDHVPDRLGLAFEELGSLSLKNIGRPVEAFVVRLDVVASAPKPVERSYIQDVGDALPLPDKPSIAVLAFTNMGGDPEQEYFSDGIAEDIITELSRNHSLFVIARNSSFTYKGHAVDVRQIARELGVRYLVEGSVRRSAGRVRITAQLIEAPTANHIWAERYDRDIEEVFAVQDEITATIVTAIVPAVSGVEQQRALRKRPENLGAWEAYQCGLWHMSKCNAVDNMRAQEFFDRAVALDIAFPSAHAAFAQSVMMQGVVYGGLPIEDATKIAIDRAQMAVEIDASDADAQAIMAFALWTAGDFVEAWTRAALAYAKNPNSASANGIRGALLLNSGHPLDGRDAVLAALRLSPRDPRDANLRSHIAISYYFEHDYPGAVEAAKHAISRHPEHPGAYRWMAAALGQLGRSSEASAALRKAIEVSPQSFDINVRTRPAWYRPEDHEHMLDGLRKAGWQS
jgi:adenylate cyclase